MSFVCRTSLNERKKYPLVLFTDFCSCNFLSVLSFFNYHLVLIGLFFYGTTCVRDGNLRYYRRTSALAAAAGPLLVAAAAPAPGGELREEDPGVKGNEWRIVCVCGSARAIDVSAAPRLIGSHGGCSDRHLGADP